MEQAFLTDKDSEISSFFDMTPDLVCIVRKDGYFKRVNKAVMDKLGYTEAELLARPIAALIHPDDQETTAREREKLMGGKPLMNFENRYLSKSGEVVWLEWTSVYFPEKELVFALAKDVTARKKLEMEVEEKYAKFKSLANYFKSSMEEDRKYLAVEIHEELAQLTYVVKMDIDWMLMNMPDLPETSRKKIEHASAVSQLLITTMRKISFALYPNMLEELGLNGSLAWLCKEFSSLSGIPCVFENDYNEEKLSVEVKMDFFRVCQESLTNVMYHSGATNAWVSIRNWSNKLTLLITDNGKGFDPARHKNAPGLLAMQERANSINGHFIIDSVIGKGTSVGIEVADGIC